MRESERRERLRTERGKKSLNSEEKVKKQQQLDGKKKKSVENSEDKEANRRRGRDLRGRAKKRKEGMKR